MYKILLIPLFLFTSGDLISESDIPSPRLGDTLNQTITLDQEEKIGRNIYRNLQKHNYIINNFLVYDYITYLGNKLSRTVTAGILNSSLNCPNYVERAKRGASQLLTKIMPRTPIATRIRRSLAARRQVTRERAVDTMQRNFRRRQNIGSGRENVRRGGRRRRTRKKRKKCIRKATKRLNKCWRKKKRKTFKKCWKKGRKKYKACKKKTKRRR